MMILKMLEGNIHGMELKPLPFMIWLPTSSCMILSSRMSIIPIVGPGEYTSIGPKDRVDVILANPPFGASVTDRR